MRNPLLYLTLLILLTGGFPFYMMGQDITVQAPSAYPSGVSVNYVRSWDVLKPETNAAAISTSSGLQQSRMTTQFADGFGRPLQTVIKQGSAPTGGSAVDMVSAYVYDEFGREQRKYLPFAASSFGGNTSVSDGLFKTNAFQQQQYFFSDSYSNGTAESPIKGQGETFFYAKTEFEPSPLNRPERAYAPGNNWVHEGKGVKTNYWLNTSTDAVRIWQVNEPTVPGDFASYITTTTYGANQLQKIVTTDEENHQSIVFTDKQGKVVLRKLQKAQVTDDGSGADHSNWICIYYIYDDLGRLRCVIQPKAVTQMQGSWTLTTDRLFELCFRYEYDTENRMIAKKVPGAAPVYMVYDKRDRLVMTQDGNMRKTGQEKWLVTVYDMLDRPVQTGLWTNTGSRAFHQSGADNSLDYYYPASEATVGAWEELTATFYDNYDWVNPTYNPGQNFGTSMNNTFSDEYVPASSTIFPYPETPAQSSLAKTWITGTKTKVLGSSPEKFLYTVSYYDAKGRVIQTQQQNVSGGVDIYTTQFGFSGLVIRSIVRHVRGGGDAAITDVVTHNYYDDLGRLSQVDKKINLKPFKTISRMEYDATGQIKHKKLGIKPGTTTAEPLETMTFDYNIRGWVLGANRSYAKSAEPGESFFGYDLSYNKAGLFNGNIGVNNWKSKGDNEMRRYTYSYDPVNRLTNALSSQYDRNEETFTEDGLKYSLYANYDDNGNFIYKAQELEKMTGPISYSYIIDGLEYFYKSNGNRLQLVIDNDSDDPDTKLGDFRTSRLHPQFGQVKDIESGHFDYTYDDNSNLVKDLNKDIEGLSGADGIDYNYLNLPQKIWVKNAAGNKGSVEYVYDANGSKLKKIIKETGQPDKTTTYMFGTYENDVLQFLAQEEGRIRPLRNEDGDIIDYAYDYMLRDHLGNVRMVLTEEQKTDEYPAATMEDDQADEEEALYANLDETRSTKPNGYPADDYTDPNDKAARLKADGMSQKIGPSIILKVMAGDNFNLRVSSWYKLNGTTPSSPVSPLTDLANALISGLPGASAGKITSQDLITTNTAGTAASQFLSARTGSGGTKPKAYVSWILLNERFEIARDWTGSIIASGYSGFDPVGDDEEFKIHTFNNIPISKNGYLYVFVSNETPNVDVYFDNLQVTHTRGPILEETHYTPFGLTMLAISSRALGFGLDNKYEFGAKEKQEKEFTDGSGFETYDFEARMYDPQLGRMMQIDPWTEEYESQSPYAGFNNNPIIFADPSGKGGELRIKYNQDGSWYIEVTASIYVYSDDKSIDVAAYAKKIQSDINYQWNHPADVAADGSIISEYSPQTTVVNDPASIIFNVTVIATTSAEATKLANENTDPSINFMGLTRNETSEALGNSGFFKVEMLDKLGSTDAAHEFGHLLGYYYDKGVPTIITPDDPTGAASKTDNDKHALRDDPEERYYIMCRSKAEGVDLSKRRVNGKEYSRLNNGKGIRTSDKIRPVKIGTLTNKIYPTN